MVDSDLTLRIEHNSGETNELVVPTPTAIEDETVTLSTISIEREIDKVARTEASVFRDRWLEIEDELDERNDALFVSDSNGIDLFGGRLDDWQYSGILVDVQIDSFETDGLDAEPPAEFVRDDESDAAIAEDLIELMPSPLYAGTVEETTSSIGYEKNHWSPGRMIRDFSESTGADVVFHPDGRVDYLEEAGSDRGEPLSSSDGTILGEPKIRRNTREGITHVRAYSEEDPLLYEEAVAIEVDEPEREVWSTAEIDSTRSSRIQAHATMRANEYKNEPEYLEVTATVDPNELRSLPGIGDRYQVVLSGYDLDKELRVISTKRSIEDKGDLVELELSNRKLTRSGS